MRHLAIVCDTGEREQRQHLMGVSCFLGKCYHATNHDNVLNDCPLRPLVRLSVGVCVFVPSPWFCLSAGSVVAIFR